MKENLKMIFSFGCGAVIGAICAFKYTERKVTLKSSDSIREAREHYEQMIVSTTNEREALKERIEELETALRASHDHIEYQDSELERLKAKDNFEEAAKENGYSIDLLPGDAPCFIDMERSGDDGYRVIEYSIYDDQTITNEKDVPLSLTEIYDILGRNNYEVMQNGDDSFYCIRNDKLRCDFEITRCAYDFDGGE